MPDVHRLANLIPEMTEEQYTALVEDIGANGLLHAITLYQGKVLDGRHRQRAIEDLAERGKVIEARYYEFTGTESEAFAYVISSNLHRRHLEFDQRAALAAVYKRSLQESGLVKHGGDRTGQECTGATLTGKAAEIAAVRFGVSPRSVYNAEAVLEAAPELHQQVIDGGMKLHEAQKVARQEKQAERRAVLIEEGATVTAPSTVEVIAADCIAWLPGHVAEFDCLVADPPYNTGRMEWDEFDTDTAYLSFMDQWMRPAFAALKPSHSAFIFCPSQYAADVEMLLRAIGHRPSSRIIWHHRNLSMGRVVSSAFARTYEVIFHCGTAPLLFSAEWDDKRFDVQTFAVPQTNFGDEKLHHAQKPLDLIRWLVDLGCPVGGKVLDPFGGSGTTGVACLESGRECVLVDQSEDFCKLMRGRLLECQR
jgi:site-specific DNA-methyltransferase (adenine-specific)